MFGRQKQIEFLSNRELYSNKLKMSNSAHIQHCARDKAYFELYMKDMDKNTAWTGCTRERP